MYKLWLKYSILEHGDKLNLVMSDGMDQIRRPNRAQSDATQTTFTNFLTGTLILLKTWWILPHRHTLLMKAYLIWL